MFNFQVDSGWSIENELRCFIIAKRLESEGSPRGMQGDMCRVLANSTSLGESTIKAKVGNYKSELGITNESNSSEATKFIVNNFGSMSVQEAEALLTGYLFGISVNSA